MCEFRVEKVGAGTPGKAAHVEQFLARGDFTRSSPILAAISGGANWEAYIVERRNEVCLVGFCAPSMLVVDFGDPEAIAAVEQILDKEDSYTTVCFLKRFDQNLESTRLGADRLLLRPMRLERALHKRFAGDGTIVPVTEKHEQVVSTFLQGFTKDASFPGQPILAESAVKALCDSKSKDIVNNKGPDSFLISADGEFAGMIIPAGPYKVDCKLHLHISKVFISAKFRGRRLGYPLVAMACDYWFENSDIESIRLQANEQYQPAVNLYLRCGFVPSEDGCIAYSIDFEKHEC
mmetsp:Transcript_12447/g.20146  ORF Transcript_12447/g.20146 Transcript_12447/m.20146 type:complete len:292 (-) Transcript_12447:12-887(-)